MDKYITKNLLRGQVCDRCKWFHLSKKVFKHKELCGKITPASEVPKIRTCQDWQDENGNYIFLGLKDKKEVEDFMRNGRNINISKECEIEGIEVFYSPTRSKIYSDKFTDGPYVYPSQGGTLKVKGGSFDEDTIKQLVEGL